jgi:biopolymer transport protein ExbB
VVGVMTVFGGVAMAGDVNVNAIAPGIAAALLATIAGLACAIPSLFGYNYLNGRISGLADQMRVFIEQLITRMAEVQANAAQAIQDEK